jgi:ABC-type Fe3+ transport system substrate-binding protein
MRTRLLPLVVLALIAAVAVGYVAYVLNQRPAVRLTVASRLSAEEADAIRAAFLASDVAKRYNVIDVEIKKLDFNLWKDLGIRGDVDLFLVGEPSVFNGLCRDGALRSLDLPELLDVAKKVPQGFVGYSDRGSVCWLGIGLGVYGFIINKDFLGRYGLPQPSSWADLASPEYAKVLSEGRSLVSFPLPSKSGTSRTTIMGILQRYGWEGGWRVLTAIGALSSFVTSSERARDDSATGAVGIAPAYIGYGLQAENVSGGKAAFVTPRGETVLYVSPVAVAAGTKHPAGAQAFILWLLGPDGQKLVVEKFGYLPALEVAGLEAMAGRTREAVLNAMNYSTEFESSVREAVVVYFEASIADPDVQKLLTEVYSRVCKTRAGEFSDWLVKLGSPLTIRDPTTGNYVNFTVDYARQVSSAIRAGTVGRDDLYQSIKEAAVGRLTRLMSELGTQ